MICCGCKMVGVKGIKIYRNYFITTPGPLLISDEPVYLYSWISLHCTPLRVLIMGAVNGEIGQIIGMSVLI